MSFNTRKEMHYEMFAINKEVSYTMNETCLAVKKYKIETFTLKTK